MLSVLIPVYKWNPLELILRLRELLLKESIDFEIIISDDTPVTTRPEYQDQLVTVSHIRCFHRNSPLSRSANRNFLADRAEYEYLLFIDCDAGIVDDKFIHRYIQQLDKTRVVAGGTKYHEHPPVNQNFYLRWKFGRKREEIPADQRNSDPWKSFSTFNFLIPKEVFMSVRFDESLTEYGHEDTLFGIRLMELEVPVMHIDNPLFHEGLEEAAVYLDKVRDSVYNLLNINGNNEVSEKLKGRVKLVATLAKLKRSGLFPVFRTIFPLLEKRIISNLLGPNPKLYLLDIYKLGLISQIA